MASPTATWGTQVVNSTANATCDITPPSLLDDDVLYAYIEQSDVTDPPALSGWSEIKGTNHDGGRTTILRKVIVTASGEPSSYAFTWTGNTRNTGVIVRVRGADTTTPEEATGTTATGDSANPDPPSATPGSSKDYLALASWGLEGKATTTTVLPTGYTAGVSGGTTGGGAQAAHASLGTAHREFTSGSAEDPTAFTTSRGDGWAADTIIVAPPPVPQTITVNEPSEVEAADIVGIGLEPVLATETETSSSVGIGLAVVKASETETVQSVAGFVDQIVPVGMVGGAGQALTITMPFTLPHGLPAPQGEDAQGEQETALVVGIKLSVVKAIETEAATVVAPVAGAQIIAVGKATETETAQIVGIGLAIIAMTETEIAQTISIGLAIIAITEIETANVVTPLSDAQLIAVGKATETEAAVAVGASVSTVHNVTVNIAMAINMSTTTDKDVAELVGLGVVVRDPFKVKVYQPTKVTIRKDRR